MATSQFAHSQSVRDGTHTSHGLSEQGVPLLTAGEIKQMRDEDIIVFHRRLPPLRLTRMDWRRYSLLADRRPLLTPILSPLPEPDIQIAKTTTRQDELVDPDDVG